MENHSLIRFLERLNKPAAIASSGRYERLHRKAREKLHYKESCVLGSQPLALVRPVYRQRRGNHKMPLSRLFCTGLLCHISLSTIIIIYRGLEVPTIPLLQKKVRKLDLWANVRNAVFSSCLAL